MFTFTRSKGTIAAQTLKMGHVTLTCTTIWGSLCHPIPTLDMACVQNLKTLASAVPEIEIGGDSGWWRSLKLTIRLRAYDFLLAFRKKYAYASVLCHLRRCHPYQNLRRRVIVETRSFAMEPPVLIRRQITRPTSGIYGLFEQRSGDGVDRGSESSFSENSHRFYTFSRTNSLACIENCNELNNRLTYGPQWNRSWNCAVWLNRQHERLTAVSWVTYACRWSWTKYKGQFLINLLKGRYLVIQELSSAVTEMGDCLATLETGRKVGRGCCGGHRLTQCGLGRGLPLYHVASWSIQPFGHNCHAPPRRNTPSDYFYP